MRYGKFTEGEWTVEFRFNWRNNQYDVIAYQGPRKTSKEGVAGKTIGAVWKDPRKSRRKPCWSATWGEPKKATALEDDFPQMRAAGLAILQRHLNS